MCMVEIAEDNDGAILNFDNCRRPKLQVISKMSQL